MTAAVLMLISCAAGDGETSRVEQARAIIKANSGKEKDGAKVVALLLEGRSREDLAAPELLLLATAYNWVGDSKEQLKASDLALKKEPRNLPGLLSKDNALLNLASRNGAAERKQALEFYEYCIREKMPQPAYWHLSKASLLCKGAVEVNIIRGEVFTAVDHEGLNRAFVEVHRAFTVDPELLSKDRESGFFVELFIEQTFPELHRQKRFRDLVDGKSKGS